MPVPAVPLAIPVPVTYGPPVLTTLVDTFHR